MPTQIIDGFRLSAATPIDTRMVTTGLASRNTLQYKYEGLRVFDIADKKAYVWIDSAWQEETLGGGGGGGATINSAITGAQNFISKFTTSGLAESVIREQLIGAEYFVGIGIATAPTRRLEVGGTVKATKFEGALDGADLGIQSVNVNKLVGGPSSGTYLLKSVNGTNAWFAEQTSASTVSVTLDNTFTKGYLVYSTSTGDGVGLYANSVSTDRSVGIKPDTVQLLASSDATNDKTAPGYSFSGQTNTGLLGNSTSIELSFKGVSRFVANDSSASLLDTSGTERIKATTSGAEIIGTTTLSTLNVSGTTTLSTLTVSGATTLSTLTVSGATTLSSTLTVGNGITVQSGNLQVSSGTLVVNTPEGTAGIVVITESSNTPVNRITNLEGTGLYIRANAEALRLDTKSGSSNFISFFSDGTGEQKNAGSDSTRRGWIGFGSNSNWNMYIYNDMNAEIQLNTSGIVRLTGSQVAIGSDVNISTGTLFTKGGEVRTSQLFRIQVEPGDPNGGSNPGPVYIGRYASDQNATTQGDLFIRVDKNSTTANYDGQYGFSVGGVFSSRKLKLTALPTSATGLASGSVWRDGNFLKIVP